MSKSWSIYRKKRGCDFMKTGRICNSIAHELDSMAQRSRESNVWLPLLPDAMLSLCVPDTNSIL